MKGAKEAFVYQKVQFFLVGTDYAEGVLLCTCNKMGGCDLCDCWFRLLCWDQTKPKDC